MILRCHWLSRLLWLLLATSSDAVLHWRPVAPAGVFVPRQFGVHRLQVAGQLVLDNGTHAPVAATVYLKVLKTSTTDVTVRAVAYMYDIAQRVRTTRALPTYITCTYRAPPRPLIRLIFTS